MIILASIGVLSRAAVNSIMNLWQFLYSLVSLIYYFTPHISAVNILMDEKRALYYDVSSNEPKRGIWV